MARNSTASHVVITYFVINTFVKTYITFVAYMYMKHTCIFKYILLIYMHKNIFLFFRGVFNLCLIGRMKQSRKKSFVNS